MAVISSLRSFDREQQKEYLIPIVIKDSGNPAMTGTSTLTVIIRDVNDNKMQPGSKEIFAYNYMVSAPCWLTGHKRIIYHRIILSPRIALQNAALTQHEQSLGYLTNLNTKYTIMR